MPKHKVKAEERAGRHQDAAALTSREVNQVEIIEERAARQDD